MMPIGYTLRSAKPSDIPLLPEVERQAAQLFLGYLDETGLTAADLNAVNPAPAFEQARQAGQLWVAETPDGAVVGLALVVILGGYGHLDELDVLPDYGRRGIGSALLNTVCDWARQSGYGAVTLRTFRDIPWNAPFYQRHGFRVVESARLSPQHVELEAVEQQRGLRIDRRVAMMYSTS
jgi:GNAT superfamily N-acetyltransferase